MQYLDIIITIFFSSATCIMIVLTMFLDSRGFMSNILFSF